MTDPVRKDDRPARVDDESSVRELAPSVAPPPPRPSVSAGAARDRLDAKLVRARALLASLSAADDRARLLHVAIVRRDEALLDGVLSSFELEGGPVSR